MEFKTFGEWLRHRRLQLDISPFAMAEELGYKRVSAIYNFEYGVAPLPMAKWPVMARVLGLTIEEFLAVMDQYAPQKVSEFRVIRGAQSAKAASNERHRVIGSSSPRPASKKEVWGEGLKAYHTEDAQTIIVLHGPSDEGLFRFVDRLWERGEKVGIVELSASQPFPHRAVVEQLKQASTIGILEVEGGVFLASLVKAAFLDALTGVAGYPHIHRVPKIYTCISEEDPILFGPERLSALLGFLERGSDSRVVRLTGPPVRA
jgi:hypothetical protein